MASYLGVVNVSFKSFEESSSSQNTPFILPEHNKHIFENLDKNVTDNTNYPYNRKLQRKVFREALSENGMRARFAQLKNFADVMDSNWRSPISQKNTFNISDPNISNHELLNQEDSIFHMTDDESLEKTEHNSIIDNSTSSQSTPQPYISPWSAHLYNTQIIRLTKEKTQNYQQFLLLEDLTAGLSYPCILDLKMGTRQHGVYATYEKKLSQERKCDRSTSKKLGTRICGMQVITKLI
jgi:hypothetical protein